MPSVVADVSTSWNTPNIYSLPKITERVIMCLFANQQVMTGNIASSTILCKIIQSDHFFEVPWL